MQHTENWIEACSVSQVPENGSAAILVDGLQIAIYNFTRRNEWFATDNTCPHWNESVLARGLLSSAVPEDPRVVCPLHKRAFSLTSGACIQGDVGPIRTYPVEIRGDKVFLELEAHRQAA